VLTLILTGLLSGIVTAISPCVLPVLPVVLTTTVQGGTRDRRRPWLVVGGLVVSFGFFTLLGGALLSLLHLPQDLLRTIGIVVLAAVGLGLLWPALGHLLERPFYKARMPKLNVDGNGFVLGMAFGLVFVPCAGPVLAAITVLAATNEIGLDLVVLTLAFCAGLAVPLLVFATAGAKILGRIRAIRERTPVVRRVAGVVMIATALVIAFNVAEPLQRATPSWLSAASDHLGSSEIDALGGSSDASFDACADDPGTLHDCGQAPDLTGITGWLNSSPLTLQQLRGKVVLLDFWTYSCINCQRTLPYLERWYSEYHDDGLVVIGVHTPEFAFEHVQHNVAENAGRLGVTYPVALDNDYETWQAYDQRYWPAHYLIDQSGEVRQVHYGEGAYDETEALIRKLLDAPLPADAGPRPAASGTTPGQSPESYLGADRASQVVNDVVAGRSEHYELTSPPRDHLSLGGTWDVEPEYARAGDDALLRYHFYASKVFLVLGGHGRAQVTLAGDPAYRRTLHITGAPTLYTLYSGSPRDDVLRLALSGGVRAYDFTFG